MMFCSNCGAELNPSASFCSNCGAKVVDTTEKRTVETDSLFDAPQPAEKENIGSAEIKVEEEPVSSTVYVDAPMYEAPQQAQTYYCTPIDEAGQPVARKEPSKPIFGIIALICAILGGMVPAIPLAIIGLKMDKSKGNRVRCILAFVIFGLWIVVSLVAGVVLGYLEATGFDFGEFQPLVDLLLEL